jgi:hypothetical protein
LSEVYDREGCDLPRALFLVHGEIGQQGSDAGEGDYITMVEKRPRI